jgi:hypothetical protein
MLDIRCVTHHVLLMRTTLNIEKQALDKARLLARQRNLSLGEIVSELILKATRSRSNDENRNGVPVFPRKAGATPDLDLVNSLRE